MRPSSRKLNPIIATLLCLALALGAVWLVGEAALQNRDGDPRALKAGAVFTHLREGDSFMLAEAYPQDWDVARFVPHARALSRREQSLLYAYDSRYADEGDAPLMLLMRGETLVVAVPLSDEKSGYPRFVDATGGRSFSLPREEAAFVCTFFDEDDGGGYYECRAVDASERLV